jgi:nitrogen fixation protein FixH
MSDSTKNQDVQKRGFFRSGKHWPWVIVGMLIFHASIIIGTLLMISAREDLYVEPDYYAKSIDWDNQRAIKENADRLGWDISFVVVGADIEGFSEAKKQVMVTLKDANGDSMDRALVEVECYHPAHANDRQYAVVHGLGDGVYETALDIQTPGFWKVQIAIRFQGMQATVVKEFEVR